ncbi:MAG: AAA family ATPase [Spirochaetes bacterium]|nr:AAA family ATPase [Spirochaetota bacterium]
MPARRRKRSKVLTVSGGKGGTGKTFISVNLAVAMAKRIGMNSASTFSANKVLLFDADYHLSNAHLMLGEKLSPCLDRFLEDPSSLPHYIVHTQYGVDLISFGGDEKRINEIEVTANEKILSELNKLEEHYEWIVVDTGAGLNKIIMRQIMFSDYTLLVINPVSTSLLDAYKVIKFMALENKRRPIDICVNMATGYQEAYQAFSSLEKTLAQFGIGVKIFFAGFVYNDPTLFHKSLREGVPALMSENSNHFLLSMNSIWEQVVKNPSVKSMESFFEKIFLGE